MCVKRSTGHTHTHTTAEQTTHTNKERATAQRRFIVEVVVAAPNIVVVRFAAESRPLVLFGEYRSSYATSIRPLDDIAITDIAWCMALKRGGVGGGRILRNGRAKVLQ